MPNRNDRKNKTTFELYSCPEFAVEGILYPGNKLFLHLDWPAKKFVPSIYKKMLLAVAQIKKGCAANGIPALYVLVPESLLKWESMFGFAPIEKWTTADDTGYLYLMKQATS